ncbi:MAG: glycosyltransferase family 2 protein [Anaerorhabdus sp.]
MAFVSIVVPVYNVEKYIGHCLDTLINQTYKDYEIICVNDGTKDNSLEILNEYQKKHPKLIKVISQENQGLSQARNTGLKYVSGKYVMFVDSDDYVENNFIECAVNAAVKNNTDLVVFDYYQEYTNIDFKEVIEVTTVSEKVNLMEDNRVLVSAKCAVWNKLYSKKLLDDNNLRFPVGMRYEDFVFTLKAMMFANEITVVNIPLLHYRVDRVGNISTKADKKVRDLIIQCKEFMEWFKNQDFFKFHKEAVMIVLLASCIWILRKVVTMDDKKFVYDYIDEHYDFLDKEFSEYKKSKDKIIVAKSDGIYLNKLQTKLYYQFRMARRKIWQK